MTSADRTDPELWEQVKTEITAGAKGGKKGEWSARKAQMAVQEYKRRGGTYAADGPDREETALHAWTEADWGTRSGMASGASGERYLPYEVRMLLTEAEYDRTSRTKRKGKGQHVDQPDDLQTKVARIQRDGPTVTMLRERAADLDIRGRSRMRKAELLAAIEAATDENGRRKAGRSRV